MATEGGRIIEKAFKLSHGGDFYKRYFEAEKERQKSHQLSKKFFDENGLVEDALKSQYILSERLTITLSPSQRDFFKKDLMTDTIDGLYRFKKSSQLQKKWVEEVYSKVDTKTLNLCRFWAFECFMKGSSALWHDGDEVYGLLKSESAFTLPDGAEEIKLSEYYKAVEKAEEKLKS